MSFILFVDSNLDKYKHWNVIKNSDLDLCILWILSKFIDRLEKEGVQLLDRREMAENLQHLIKLISKSIIAYHLSISSDYILPDL